MQPKHDISISINFNAILTSLCLFFMSDLYVSLAGDLGFLSYFIMIGTVDSVATLSTGTLLRVLPTVPSAINALHTKAGSLT